MKNLNFFDSTVDSRVLIFSTDDIVATSPLAEAMKKAEEKKVREEAKKPEVSQSVQRLNLKTVQVAEVTVEDAEKLAATMQENRKYAEGLGQKKAELEEAVRKIEAMVLKNGGDTDALLLLPPESRKALANNKRTLQQVGEELIRMEKDEPSIRAHTNLAYLIRKVEIEIKLVQNGGQVNGAAHFMELALKSGRFRVATKDERIAKTKPSHTVFGRQMMIAPMELTRGNKILAERLIELCKIDKREEVSSFQQLVDAMKAKGTHSLRQIIARPKGGEVVYIHFPKKQLSGGKWLSGGHILCRVDSDGGDRFRLVILDVIGPENVATEYTRMKKAKRFLPLVFLKAGKITAYIENPEVFNDTRIFLLDVLRGLEYEQAEAVKAASANEKRS